MWISNRKNPIVELDANQCTHNDGINLTRLSARRAVSLRRARFQTAGLRNRRFTLTRLKARRDGTTTARWKRMLKRLSPWRVLNGSPSRSDRILLFSPAYFYCKLCATRKHKGRVLARKQSNPSPVNIGLLSGEVLISRLELTWRAETRRK